METCGGGGGADDDVADFAQLVGLQPTPTGLHLERVASVVGGGPHVFHVCKAVVEKKTCAVSIPVPLDQRGNEGPLAVRSLAHGMRVRTVHVVMVVVVVVVVVVVAVVDRVEPRPKEADRFKVTPKCRREAHGDDEQVQLGSMRCVK